MNLRDIAEAVGCSEKTVRTRAKKLWPDRVFIGGAALNEQDAIALAEALPKRNMVSGNFTADTGNSTAGTYVLPAATKLREVRLLFQSGAIEKPEVRTLLGLPEIRKEPEEPYADPETATAILSTGLTKLIGGRA